MTWLIFKTKHFTSVELPVMGFKYILQLRKIIGFYDTVKVGAVALGP